MIRESTVLIGYVDGASGQPQWLRFGLPLRRGQATAPACCRLFDAEGEALEADFRPVTHWPDRSSQWMLIDALVCEQGPVYLQTDAAPTEMPRKTDDSTVGAWQQDRDRPVLKLEHGFSVEPCIVLEGRSRTLTLKEVSTRHEGLCAEQVATFRSDTQSDLNIVLHIMSIRPSEEVRLSVSIHNQSASVHPGGRWDLGDPNSIDIDDFSLVLRGPDNSRPTLRLQDALQREPSGREFSGGRLTQYGSGGQNWDAPTHVDRTGRVAVQERGFRLQDDDGQVQAEGLRADPVVMLENNELRLLIQPHRFWQNFPAALSVSENELRWHLFPSTTELQPGEAKTWEMTAGPAPGAPRLRYDPGYLNDSRVLLGCHLPTQNALAELLQQEAIAGSNSFFHKREASDEFGWRHFGELYADHEALNRDDEEIFVSHYNNQYDPLCGFTLQYLSTGDARWLELAHDLARHVIDIDIYKTEQDKVEYNNGLFWHTDHYLPALTATHRTYSRDHEYAYDGHQGGGGPGGQHCYTSGLALHHLLTGNKDAADAVIGLSDWIHHFYNGAGNILGRIHRLLTVDLKAGSMTNIGYREPGFQYPLDRGTGNHLNALIDRYQITQEPHLLKQMHGIVIGTVSPTDDLASRKLDDVENHWFYIIFLQALARYLLLKEQREQIDDQYAYARHAFEHYAAWVSAHEKPYLSDPGALEFPTDTWAAQDLRKAGVLYLAAYFMPQKRGEMLARAEDFWSYCVDTLNQSPERHTTRVLAIIAQNLGVREWALSRESSPYPLAELQSLRVRKPSLAGGFLRDLGRSLRSFSLADEIQWLKGRAGRR